MTFGRPPKPPAIGLSAHYSLPQHPPDNMPFDTIHNENQRFASHSPSASETHHPSTSTHTPPFRHSGDYLAFNQHHMAEWVATAGLDATNFNYPSLDMSLFPHLQMHQHLQNGLQSTTPIPSPTNPPKQKGRTRPVVNPHAIKHARDSLELASPSRISRHVEDNVPAPDTPVYPPEPMPTQRPFDLALNGQRSVEFAGHRSRQDSDETLIMDHEPQTPFLFGDDYRCGLHSTYNHEMTLDDYRSGITSLVNRFPQPPQGLSQDPYELLPQFISDSLDRKSGNSRRISAISRKSSISGRHTFPSTSSLTRSTLSGRALDAMFQPLELPPIVGPSGSFPPTPPHFEAEMTLPHSIDEWLNQARWADYNDIIPSSLHHQRPYERGSTGNATLKREMKRLSYAVNEWKKGLFVGHQNPQSSAEWSTVLRQGAKNGVPLQRQLSISNAASEALLNAVLLHYTITVNRLREPSLDLQRASWRKRKSVTPLPKLDHTFVPNVAENEGHQHTSPAAIEDEKRNSSSTDEAIVLYSNVVERLSRPSLDSQRATLRLPAPRDPKPDAWNIAGKDWGAARTYGKLRSQEKPKAETGLWSKVKSKSRRKWPSREKLRSENTVIAVENPPPARSDMPRLRTQEFVEVEANASRELPKIMELSDENVTTSAQPSNIVPKEPCSDNEDPKSQIPKVTDIRDQPEQTCGLSAEADEASDGGLETGDGPTNQAAHAQPSPVAQTANDQPEQKEKDEETLQQRAAPAAEGLQEKECLLENLTTMPADAAGQATDIDDEATASEFYSADEDINAVEGDGASRLDSPDEREQSAKDSNKEHVEQSVQQMQPSIVCRNSYAPKRRDSWALMDILAQPPPSSFFDTKITAPLRTDSMYHEALKIDDSTSQRGSISLPRKGPNVETKRRRASVGLRRGIKGVTVLKRVFGLKSKDDVEIASV